MRKSKVFFISILITISGCNWLPASFHDNVVEERSEDYIEEKTGIEIDFTGSSKEK